MPSRNTRTPLVVPQNDYDPHRSAPGDRWTRRSLQRLRRLGENGGPVPLPAPGGGPDRNRLGRGRVPPHAPPVRQEPGGLGGRLSPPSPGGAHLFTAAPPPHPLPHILPPLPT